MSPRFSDVKVTLICREIDKSNSFAAITARVAAAMRQHGIDDAEIDQFLTECRSGDYGDLLATCARWVACH